MRVAARQLPSFSLPVLLIFIVAGAGCDNRVLEDLFIQQWTHLREFLDRQRARLIDRNLTDFSYSVGDDGVTFRFRDTLKRNRDTWGVGLFYEFEWPGGPLLTSVHAAPVDTEGNYEAFFSWEMLGKDPGGPPYDANIWRVVEIPGDGGSFTVRSPGFILEPNWLPDIVNRNLTDFGCETTDNGILLRFRDEGDYITGHYSVALLDDQGNELAWLPVVATDDNGSYEVALNINPISPNPSGDLPTESGIPANVARRAMTWVVIWSGSGQVHTVSTPQPLDALQPALSGFAYRVETDTIYFSFRDMNFAHAGERGFEVWLADAYDGHVDYGVSAAAELIDDEGWYQAEYARAWAYGYDAWCVIENLGHVVFRSELQSLDRQSVAPQETP